MILSVPESYSVVTSAYFLHSSFLSVPPSLCDSGILDNVNRVRCDHLPVGVSVSSWLNMTCQFITIRILDNNYCTPVLCDVNIAHTDTIHPRHIVWFLEKIFLPNTASTNVAVMLASWCNLLCCSCDGKSKNISCISFEETDKESF